MQLDSFAQVVQNDKTSVKTSNTNQGRKRADGEGVVRSSSYIRGTVAGAAATATTTRTNSRQVTQALHDNLLVATKKYCKNRERKKRKDLLLYKNVFLFLQRRRRQRLGVFSLVEKRGRAATKPAKLKKCYISPSLSSFSVYVCVCSAPYFLSPSKKKKMNVFSSFCVINFQEALLVANSSQAVFFFLEEK